MRRLRELDTILKRQAPEESALSVNDVMDYARGMAAVEGVIAVVSDMVENTSRIFCGAFAGVLGVKDYTAEDSIWEKAILDQLPETERELKYLTELRFYHYLRHLPKRRRRHYCLMARLRIYDMKGELHDILHRMYYVYEPDGEAIRYAICLYGPLTPGFHGTGIVVDTLTGMAEPLTAVGTDRGILGRRELQVLALVDRGLTSAEIADTLSISRHTVSRHRQEILAKLQVKNSPEACRVAKALGLM